MYFIYFIIHFTFLSGYYKGIKMLRQRTIKVEDTFHYLDLQRVHVVERYNYLTCKRLNSMSSLN